MQVIESVEHYRVRVRDFHKMAEVGIFGENDRIELIEGALIRMAPIGSLHAGTVTQLSQLFTGLAANRAVVYAQNPIVLGKHSELQPDIALLQPRADFYKQSLPGPRDTLLVIEIADTTLSYDRETKIPLYAQYGIAEAWLIDLRSRRLEIFLKPASDGYRRILRPADNERVAPSLRPEMAIHVGHLWL